MTEPAPNLGHNLPPTDPQVLAENLNERHGDIVRRANELVEAAARVPETVEDDDTAGKVSDYIKQLTACRKQAETTRVGQKEPYLAAGRTVDGFFKKVIEPLDQTKAAVQRRLDKYLREKQEAERKRREETERRARIEAEQKRREAEAAARGFQTPEEMDAAIAAEDAAEKASHDAAKAEKEAHAKAADLSRTRGDYGSTASLQTFWTFRDINRDELDLEALRYHLPADALEKAVRAFIKAGGRELRGVEIFKDYKSNVR